MFLRLHLKNLKIEWHCHWNSCMNILTSWPFQVFFFNSKIEFFPMYFRIFWIILVRDYCNDHSPSPGRLVILNVVVWEIFVFFFWIKTRTQVLYAYLHITRSGQLELDFWTFLINLQLILFEKNTHFKIQHVAGTSWIVNYYLKWSFRLYRSLIFNF